jgi:hypothetical protein
MWQLRLAAAEEAGHAVACRALGGRVAEPGISLIPDASSKGRAHLDMPATSEPLVSATNTMIVAASGHLAVLMMGASDLDGYGGPAPTPSASEIVEAMSTPLGVVGAANGAHSDNERAEREAATVTASVVESRALFDYSTARARRLLAEPRNRAALEHLAALLVERIEVSPEQAEAVMAWGDASADLDLQLQPQQPNGESR